MGDRKGTPEISSKCNGYLNCRVKWKNGRKINRKWGLYWVKLNAQMLEFYSVEWMVNASTDHPPPDDTTEPDQHKHIQNELCFDITNYQVDLLPAYKKGKKGSRGFVFHLTLTHMCLECSRKCSREGEYEHEVLLQAPNDVRCHDWAQSLREVTIRSGVPIRGIEVRASRVMGRTKPKLSSPKVSTSSISSSERLEQIKRTERELELLRDKLSQCRLTEEHLNYMYGAVQKSKEIAQIYHYYNKSTKQYELVNSLRDPLITTVTKDYYLYPGADWSRLPQGEEVFVIGRHYGNMYCIMTKKQHVCCQANPIKWDSGFLSVAATSRQSMISTSTTSISSSDSEPEELEPEVFAVEMEQSSSSVDMLRSHSWSHSTPSAEGKKGFDPLGARPLSCDPPTGDPPTGDPPTGDPPTGDPPTGDPPTGDPPTGDPSTDDPPTGDPSTGDPPTGDPPTGDPPIRDDPPTGDPPTDDPPTGDPPTGDPPTDDPPTGDPPTGDPPTDDPPTGDPPTGDPPTDDPPTGDPPTGDPPTDDPPTGDPPTDDPPTGDPPTGDLIHDSVGGKFMETVLLGFVAGSALEAFADEVDQCPLENEEKRWCLDDFKALWQTDDDIGSDFELASLGTPSSASTSSHSIVTFLEPENSSSVPNLRPVSSPPGSNLSRSLTPNPILKPARKPFYYSLRLKRTISPKPPLTEIVKKYVRPVFGLERDVVMDPGTPGCEDTGFSFGFELDSFDPEGRFAHHVFLVNVLETGTAFKSGMRQGDTILSVDDIDVSCKSKDAALKALFKAQEAALREGRKLSLRVAWRDGDRVLSWARQSKEKLRELKLRQREFENLIDKERKILSKVLKSEPSQHMEKSTGNHQFAGQDVIEVGVIDVDQVKADFLVLPTCCSLSIGPTEDPNWKRVGDIRSLAGDGLRAELAMNAPLRKGHSLLTGGHNLPVKGVLHIAIIGSSHELLEAACLEALQTVQTKGGLSIVFMGFQCEMSRVLMVAILKYIASSSPSEAKDIRCVFDVPNASDVDVYWSSLKLAQEHIAQLPTPRDRKYSNFMDGVVMTAEQDKRI